MLKMNKNIFNKMKQKIELKLKWRSRYTYYLKTTDQVTTSSTYRQIVYMYIQENTYYMYRQIIVMIIIDWMLSSISFFLYLNEVYFIN